MICDGYVAGGVPYVEIDGKRTEYEMHSFTQGFHSQIKGLIESSPFSDTNPSSAKAYWPYTSSEYEKYPGMIFSLTANPYPWVLQANTPSVANTDYKTGINFLANQEMGQIVTDNADGSITVSVYRVMQNISGSSKRIRSIQFVMYYVSCSDEVDFTVEDRQLFKIGYVFSFGKQWSENAKRLFKTMGSKNCPTSNFKMKTITNTEVEVYASSNTSSGYTFYAYYARAFYVNSVKTTARPLGIIVGNDVCTFSDDDYKLVCEIDPAKLAYYSLDVQFYKRDSYSESVYKQMIKNNTADETLTIKSFALYSAFDSSTVFMMFRDNFETPITLAPQQTAELSVSMRMP